RWLDPGPWSMVQNRSVAPQRAVGTVRHEDRRARETGRRRHRHRALLRAAGTAARGRAHALRLSVLRRARRGARALHPPRQGTGLHLVGDRRIAGTLRPARGRHGRDEAGRGGQAGRCRRQARRTATHPRRARGARRVVPGPRRARTLPDPGRAFRRRTTMTDPHHHHGGSAAGTATDPVCGMTVDPAKTPHHHVHGGVEYHFCNPRCREKFIADPDKYLAPRADEPEPAIPGVIYTCPMHPQIRQEGPGPCPICGMALEPEMPSLDEGENPELVDFSRRFWWTLPLTAAVFVL